MPTTWRRGAGKPTSPPESWRFDGFVSYCTAADRPFAPKIQEGLERLTQSWRRRPALAVFQDIDDLAATLDLEGAFAQLFAESQTLVFLASPGAAASQWCNDEVSYWIRNRAPEQMVVVLTDGTLGWVERHTECSLRDAGSDRTGRPSRHEVTIEASAGTAGGSGPRRTDQ